MPPQENTHKPKRNLVWQGTKPMLLLTANAENAEKAENAENDESNATNKVETVDAKIHVYEETRPKYLLLAKMKFKPKRRFQPQSRHPSQQATSESCKVRREFTKQDMMEVLENAFEPFQPKNSQRQASCPTRQEFVEWMLKQFLIKQTDPHKCLFSLELIHSSHGQVIQPTPFMKQHMESRIKSNGSPSHKEEGEEDEKKGEEDRTEDVLEEDEAPPYEQVRAAPRLSRSMHPQKPKSKLSIRSSSFSSQKSNEWSEDKHHLEVDIAISKKQLSKLQWIEQRKKQMMELQQQNQWKLQNQQRQLFQQKHQDCVSVRNKILDAVEFQQLVNQQQLQLKKQQVVLQRQWQQQLQNNLRGRRNSVKWLKGAVIGHNDRHSVDDSFGLASEQVGLTSEWIKQNGVAYDLNGRKHLVTDSAAHQSSSFGTHQLDLLNGALHKIRKWIDTTIAPPSVLSGCQVFRQADLTHKGWLRVNKFVRAMASTCHSSDVLEQQTKLSSNQLSAIVHRFGIVKSVPNKNPTEKLGTILVDAKHFKVESDDDDDDSDQEEEEDQVADDGWICYEKLFWGFFDAALFLRRFDVSRRQQLEDALEQFDADHSGQVSWQQLRQSLEEIHLVPSEEELQLLRLRFDPLRRDGKRVDYRKFLVFVDAELPKHQQKRRETRLLQQLNHLANSQKQIHQLVRQMNHHQLASTTKSIRGNI